MQVWSLGGEDPLEEGMAAHSSILAGESHGQRSLVGYDPWSCRVGHDCTHAHTWREHSHGRMCTNRDMGSLDVAAAEGRKGTDLGQDSDQTEDSSCASEERRKRSSRQRKSENQMIPLLLGLQCPSYPGGQSHFKVKHSASWPSLSFQALWFTCSASGLHPQIFLGVLFLLAFLNGAHGK